MVAMKAMNITGSTTVLPGQSIDESDVGGTDFVCDARCRESFVAVDGVAASLVCIGEAVAVDAGAACKTAASETGESTKDALEAAWAVGTECGLLSLEAKSAIAESPESLSSDCVCIIGDKRRGARVRAPPQQHEERRHADDGDDGAEHDEHRRAHGQLADGGDRDGGGDGKGGRGRGACGGDGGDRPLERADSARRVESAELTRVERPRRRSACKRVRRRDIVRCAYSLGKVTSEIRAEHGVVRKSGSEGGGAEGESREGQRRKAGPCESEAQWHHKQRQEGGGDGGSGGKEARQPLCGAHK
eukprot:6188106-Pleurochrysis_carterae.AAC.6